MANTYIEPATKKKLLEYNITYGHKSPSRGIDGLLAESRELRIIRRENRLLHRLYDLQSDSDEVHRRGDRRGSGGEEVGEKRVVEP